MAHELHTGSVFAGFTIDGFVASGGMGSVFRATDPTLHRLVAVKVVAKELADDPTYRRRFLLEAGLAARLAHPGIVPVYGAGEFEGQLYLAMQFMEGGSLADLIKRSGVLSLPDAITLLRPIADALDTAHAAGLVHRDVKPGNILLQDGRACLADFGLALPPSTEDSELNVASADLSGTTAYLAPEQIEGDALSGATDQYALACVLAECLTGQQPFVRDNDLAVVYAHLQEPPPSLAALRHDLPESLDPVIARGLAKDPADRFGSCRQLMDAVEAATQDAPAVGVPPRRKHVKGAAVGIGLLAVAVTATLVLVPGARPFWRSSGGQSDTDNVTLINPEDGRVKGHIDVGSGPLAIAAGGSNVWVVNADTRTISVIDAKHHKVVGPSFGLSNSSPIGLAYGLDALWVAAGSKFDNIDFGTITDSVVRVDPTTNVPGDPIPLAPESSSGFHHGGNQIAVGGGAVWVIDSAGALQRIDPGSRKASIVPNEEYQASSVAFGDDLVWVLGVHLNGQGAAPDGPWVWSIDPRTLGRSKPISVAATGASDIAVGNGSVWVASPWDGFVYRITPGPQNVVSTIASPGATKLSYDPARQEVWVANPVDGTVRKVDPSTGGAVIKAQVAGAPQDVTAAGGMVFASVIGAGSQRVQTRKPGVGDVQLEGCSTVSGDPAKPPDLLIVGDYPLDNPSSRADSEAVAAVLREHRFKAGSHTVGYQTCDDAGRGQVADNSDATCRQHAEAYAAASHVVAVVTGYLSDCAIQQLPVLASAQPGPIAAIGPVNTSDALTAGTFQNFVRMTPKDSQHTSADVGVLLDAGATNVFVLSDFCSGCSYVPRVAELFTSLAAGRLSVAGQATYGDPKGASSDSVAKRVAASGANGVYLIGFTDQETGDVLKALRTVGRPLVIVTPDGFTPVKDGIVVAGDAATGVYVTSSNPPNGSLPPVGRQWLRRFSATQLGDQVPTSSALSAAAAEALLDAIARSDGTRASVTSALRSTDLPNSIIGPVRFTPSGDIADCAISVYQITGGTAFLPDIQSDLQGARFDKRIGCSAVSPSP